MSSKKKAVALVADCKKSDLTHSKWDHYGLTQYELDRSMEYAVGTDAEMDEAVAENIRQSLWAFNREFLAEFTDLPVEVFTGLTEMYENANEAIEKLIERSDRGMDAFVEKAVGADGRGHFLASYDGNEESVEVDGTTYYVVRVS